MFGLFKKSPIKKLEAEYRELMAEAMNVQRSGDLRRYAEMIDQSEGILSKIEDLKAKQGK